MASPQHERIGVIVSTMNYREGALCGLLKTIPSEIPVTIVNQVSQQELERDAHTRIQHNVQCFTYGERGLSRSRNKLIDLASEDFLLVCDDDIQFECGAFAAIAKALRQFPDDDVLTFRMSDLDGKPRKAYPEEDFLHNRWSIARVSSCEIGFRKKRIQETGIRYDERFGLGAQYPGGEEVVFLKDCIDRGLSVRYVPIAISRHPVESTGRKMDKRTEYARGALFRQLYGILAWGIGPAFYLKKRIQLGDRVKICASLRAYLRGCLDLPKNRI